MTSRIAEPRSEQALAQCARRLLRAGAVRERAQRLLALALDGRLQDWSVDLNGLQGTADLVADVIRERYPRLDVPVHSRWRHFVVGGRDLWADITARASWRNTDAAARSAFDLVITSVLLDAGAGPAWRYRDRSTGLSLGRSEGLALASLRWFENAGLSRNPRDAYRVDAASLRHTTCHALQAAFQVDEANPLLGLEGRVALLNRLGAVANARPDLFAMADSPRPGGLFDALRAQAANGRLPAARILETLLEALGPIWQGRPTLGGVSLGDCWPHPALSGDSPEDGYVPLHKLSQWLTYSLIEPLTTAGIRVTDVHELTGLAEYRNGGLFVDTGVLKVRDRADLEKAHAVTGSFVVGWRALTVALLDRLLPLVGTRLGLEPEQLPLASLLEGGSWAAGRLIARRKRSDGGPPFQVISDGTLF